MNKLLTSVQSELQNLSNKKIAGHSQRFFKTGKGEYGEGDTFSGIRVPVLRQLARKYKNLTLQEVVVLLQSPFHESRLLALFLLVYLYKRSDNQGKKNIFKLYLSNTEFINNWDLVDSSAEHIVGAFLFEKNKKPLYGLARSKNLWGRRISILSTFHFIKRNQFDDALAIAEVLLFDKEDLIHKAVGWMLRETGNRYLPEEEQFLKKYYKQMPGTMLRYAIEKFPQEKRKQYLTGMI